MVVYTVLTRLVPLVVSSMMAHSGCMFVFGRVIRCAKMGFFASLTHLISVVVSIPVVHLIYMAVYVYLVHFLILVASNGLVHFYPTVV